jgi:hypothetical protein
VLIILVSKKENKLDLVFKVKNILIRILKKYPKINAKIIKEKISL